MKHSFNFSNPAPADSEENVLPLINIVFLLLIFFLIAGAITIPDLFPVEPPVSDSETPAAPVETIVLIGPDGQISLQNEWIAADQLSALARAIIKQKPLQPFKLKADSQAASGQVIRAIEALRNAGVQQTLLITSQDD